VPLGVRSGSVATSIISGVAGRYPGGWVLAAAGRASLSAEKGGEIVISVRPAGGKSGRMGRDPAAE